MTDVHYNFYNISYFGKVFTKENAIDFFANEPLSDLDCPLLTVMEYDQKVNAFIELAVGE